MLLVLDNFAEFRESFPDELDSFTSLAREGRAYGLHILIAAEQVTAVPPKIYSLFTERLALRLADTSEYAAVVGRGLSDAAEVPGRGFIRYERKEWDLARQSLEEVVTRFPDSTAARLARDRLQRITQEGH